MSVAHVSIEGIVACINWVEVNVSIKEDVEPEPIREIGTVWSDDEIILSSPRINDIVCFKSQGLHNIRVKGGISNGDARPGKKRFVD